MRFALIATSVAAAAIVPFALQASKPQMSGDQFVGAVRCAAYEMVLSPDGDTAAQRFRLNGEAQRQPVDVAQQAQAVAHEIASRAVANNSGNLGAERAEACTA